MLHTVLANSWDHVPQDVKNNAVDYLESGHVLFFPTLPFSLMLEEKFLLNPEHADPLSKNISYYPKKHQLWGVQRLSDEERMVLKLMLDRFAQYAQQLIDNTLPDYAKDLIVCRTSYRPVQITGRKTSYRKDDKRLHVDAFPSAPNQGKRILRVFSNINPFGEDRVWRLGEPFEKVVDRFLPTIDGPVPGFSALLRFLRITKSYRTKYDHYMLHLHDRMKADNAYQKEAQQEQIHFPPGSTWIVQTDHVSHAAMQGQYLLEQTFYLPINAMRDESKSPLRILEKKLSQKLI